MSDFWHGIGSWFGDVQAGMEFITAVIVPIIVLGLLLSAGRVTGPQRWVLFAPVRAAAKKVRKAEGVPKHDVKVAFAAVSAYLKQTLDQPDAPVAALSQTLTGYEGFEKSKQLEPAHRIAREAVLPGRNGVLARAFWPLQAGLVKERMTDLRDHLEGIVALTLPGADGEADGVSEFATTLSAYTGAIVLADGASSRSGVVERFHVWHTGRWTGPNNPHLDSGNLVSDKHDIGDGYIERHTNVNANVLSGDSGSQGKPMAAGDYDGRILDVRAVRLRLDGRTQGIVAVLETNESCYVVSERSLDFAGKHLAPDLSSAPDPRTAKYELEGHDFVRTSSPDGGRVVLLATAISLVSYGEDGPALILARRSDRARNAHDVLSATAGGVFELGRGLAVGDVDEFGNADPMLSALREAEEELGVVIQPQDVGAMAVFYSNILGRSRAGDAKAQATEGQLGVTTVFLAHTGLTLPQLERERSLHADWSKGRYELDRLEEIKMPVPDSRSSAHVSKAASDFVRELAARSGELDQNAMISALYASAHLYGHGPTMKHLKDLPDPWWATAWLDGSETSRLVRDPYVLAPELAQRMAEVSATWTARRAGAGLDPFLPTANVGTRAPW